MTVASGTSKPVDISSKTAVTAASDDELLIADASDNYSLKKILISSIATLIDSQIDGGAASHVYLTSQIIDGGGA